MWKGVGVGEEVCRELTATWASIVLLSVVGTVAWFLIVLLVCQRLPGVVCRLRLRLRLLVLRFLELRLLRLLDGSD